ncbi:leucyl aminopeptidase [Naasia lichenicola]|uniref:Probable cytosol aminopeptidase n=1 Tax=Naasia lichenicola TaxID=2565933 RepID=A0A4S4FQT9_9MICO|nr:leucyl aminopeptidase [Naasia lichenicola]THG32949.1 leucyl aminopeptidase [Naasia lichenicola]
MPIPELSVSSLSPAEIETDVLVIGVSTEGDSAVVQSVPGLPELGEIELFGASGRRDHLVRIPSVGIAAKSVALIGLGTGELTADSLRYAAGSVTRQLRGATTIAFALPTSSVDQVTAVLEGAAIGAYSYTEYRVDSLAGAKPPVSSITAVSALDGADAAPVRAAVTATAMATVRDLVNAPPSDLYPETFASRAAELADGLDVELTVWDEEALERDGFGGILGVGKGSIRGPRLVKVVWSPEGATKHLALVGKGITFDSGGLSLKPAASMIGMKYDMTGAATVLSAALAAAALDLPVKVTAWLCLAENMPSGSAARPNDVIRIRGGKTVEVLNTDAEGRLVLADGLVAAGEEQPDAIIDVATLTGAASVALGTRYVGAMGDEGLIAELLAAGRSAGELLWHMPLPAELRPLLASDVADIANIKPGNTAGGMLIAAVFLADFIAKREASEPSDSTNATTNATKDATGEKIPWAHLDIAGAANNAGAFHGFTGKGPTAVMVRTLIALAESYAS